MEIETSNTHTGHGPTNIMTFILWICAGFFTWLQSVTVDDLWMWSFRALSGISVAIAIYVNYHKAKDIYMAKHKKKKR